MTDRELLFRAIVEQPHDETVRLVYADALDETGNEEDRDRAELIRLQIELNAEPVWSLARFEKSRRIAELLQQRRKTWLRGMPSWFTDPFEGGFTQTVHASVTQLIRRLPTLMSREPVSHLVIYGSMNRLGELLRMEEMQRIRKLRLVRSPPQGNVPDRAIRELVEAEHLQYLETLELFDLGLGEEVPRWFAESEAFPRLKELNLNRNQLGSRGLASLVQQQRWSQLERLHLAENRLGPEGIDYLAHWRTLGSVRSLDLGGEILSRTTVQNRGVALLCASKYLGKIEQLTLKGNAIDDHGAVSLAQATAWKSLRNLDLSFNLINDPGVEAISRAPWINQLEKLDIYGNLFTGIGVRSLLSRGANRMQKLILGGSHLLAVEPLKPIRAGRFESLQVVDLRGADLTPESLESLLQSDSFRQVESLSLAGNRLETKGLEILVRHPFPRLKQLTLDDTHLNHHAIQLLTANPFAPALQELDLSNNPLGPFGLQALCEAKSFPELRSLKLFACNLVDESVLEFARSRLCHELFSLMLGGNTLHWSTIHSLRDRLRATVID